MSMMGIRETLQKEGVLEALQFKAIRQSLLNQVATPSVVFKGSPYVAYGDRLAVKVEGLPLPTLDLYENKLLKDAPRSSSAKIFAVFPGIGGPIVVPVEHDEKAAEIRVTVPKHAIDGRVTFRFSVKEYLGPLSLVDNLDPTDDAFRESLNKYNPTKKARERCYVGAPKWDKGRIPPILITPCLPDPSDNDYEQMPEHMEASRHAVETSLVLYPRCYSKDAEGGVCTICPNGAIELDGYGNCRVDPDKCLGQSFERNNRDEASICWECFTGDEIGPFSNRCFKRKLRRVLHIGPACCGQCEVKQVCDDTRELLAQGSSIDALSHEVISLDENDHCFVVNKEYCVGCMACINSVDCSKNDKENAEERTLRMVAYVSGDKSDTGILPPGFSSPTG